MKLAMPAALVVVVVLAATACDQPPTRTSGDGEPAAATCPPLTDADALARFGACMELSTWQETGMCSLGSQQTAAGACHTCHEGRTEVVFLSDSCGETFDRMRRDPSPLLFGTLFEVGDGHPELHWSPAVLVAYDAFMNRTYERYLDCSVPCGGN